MLNLEHTQQQAAEAAAYIRRQWPQARPRMALVLGSGWGGVADRLEGAQALAYADVPGFPLPAVQGHSGRLLWGRLGAHELLVLTGRKHAYETGDPIGMCGPLCTLKALGVELLVQTNAAGSLDPALPPGSVMLLSDHLNLPQRSPLVGVGGNARFVAMADAYDPRLREQAKALAARRGRTLQEGVYAWALGPQFETPAEIRMAAMLGARAIGMSTVPETIWARYLGMRVLALSMLTNMGAGLSDEQLSHAHTLQQAERASAAASGLLADLLADLVLES